MTAMTEIDKIVESIADDIRPEVESIEANKNPTTKGNYGKYLQLLGIFDDTASRNVYALALIKAGANQYGVKEALKLF
jgi:hypothetical protein